MSSLEDCIALCGLTRSEVAAIAEHEHVSEAVAATLGQYLLREEPGKIQQMIIDDIRLALMAGNTMRAAQLLSALQDLLTTHGKDHHGKRGCCRD